MMAYSYRATLKPDADGRLVVHFPALPEALTDGADEAEALREAADCLSEALASRIVDGEEIPAPEPPGSGQYLVSPSPTIALKTALYEALRRRGYAEEGECVNIEGVPVQFLPAYNALLEEALREARGTAYEDTPTHVLRAEHLVAICLQTGRDKDRERVRIFREQAELDLKYLAEVLQRHGLEAKWNQWTT